MTRADDGDSMLCQGFDVATNVQYQWRIVDLPQPRRIERVVQRDKLHAGGVRFRNFILCQFK